MFQSMRQKKRILRKQPFKICIIKFDKKCNKKKRYNHGSSIVHYLYFNV